MSNSCWFITGTSSGLGKALAEAVLCLPDAYVMGFARRQVLEHVRYTHHSIDLSDVSAVEKCAFSLPPDCHTIVLINNAGSLGDMAFTGSLDAMRLQQTYQLNAITPHVLSNKFIAAFSELPIKKVIIQISSGAAQNAYPGWSVYCASKAALEMQTKCMRLENAHRKYPFFIYAIAPGIMDTDMQMQIRASDAQAFPRKEKFVALHAEGKLLKPEVIAEAYVRFVQNCTGEEEPIQKISL